MGYFGKLRYVDGTGTGRSEKKWGMGTGTGTGRDRFCMTGTETVPVGKISS